MQWLDNKSFNVEFEFVLSHIIEKYITYIKVTFNFAHSGKKKGNNGKYFGRMITNELLETNFYN